MKKIVPSVIALLFSVGACAQSPVFTSLSSTGGTIFAGVKLESKGNEPETYLIKVSSAEMTSDKIALPSELSNREVVALFPAEKNLLVVMSQKTVEQGDKPQFHSFDTSKKEWKKLAEADCVSFAKLKVEKEAVTFVCVETNAKGDEVENLKKVSLKGVTLTQPGEITLPLAKIEKDAVKAELLGDSFEWKELKVGVDKKEKVFRP